MRRSRLRKARVPVASAIAIAVACGIGTTQAYANAAPPGAADGWSATPKSVPADGTAPAKSRPDAVPAEPRAELLGTDYPASADRAFTTSGDGTGF
ncbi:hypothetical protein, partial [Streptomyces sp. NPDC127574]|uniref:hypothetical protein n=1 Tax=Streptomyces sp. NPDC127574 TaxID=3345401 RepID=UPI003630E827